MRAIVPVVHFLILEIAIQRPNGRMMQGAWFSENHHQ